MLPLSGHLERAGPGCDGKREDYRGQFLAGCTEGWCNATALVSGSVQTTLVLLEGAIRSSLGKRLVSALQFCCLRPADGENPRPLCCFAQTLSWRETGAERNSYVGGLKRLRRGRGWGVVVVFSCMQPDPETQVQPPCSPLSTPPTLLPAAKCLSIWSSIKSWLLWICLFQIGDLQR